MSTLSRVNAHPSRAMGTKWYEYGIRFLFGGVVTAVIGIVARAYGPVVAGLFLAFPAILPASLTLVAKHEGEGAAGADSIGAALGSIGLAGFGLMVWALASRAPGWLVLALATVVWTVLSIAAWPLFDRMRHG